jgi:hypothetical protein
MTENQCLLTYSPAETDCVTLSDQKQSIEEQKEYMSSGTQPQTMASMPAQSCVVTHDEKPPAPPKDPKADVCKFSQLSITAEKTTKVISVQEVLPPLQVVSGYKNETKEIHCKIVDLVGPCPKHTKKTFDLAGFKQKSNNELVFKTASIPFYKIFSNGVLFPWNARTSEYTINANTCGGSISQKLVVYPDVKMSIDIPVSFAKKKIGKKKDIEGVNSETSQQTNFQLKTKSNEGEIKVNAKYEEDGNPFEISPSINRSFDKILTLVELGDKAFSTLQKALDETIEIEFQRPAGSIHLDFEWKELEGQFVVDSSWTVTINLNPLFGVKVTINLDEAILLLCTGPIGKFYAEIKRLLEKVNVKIELVLEITGTIGIEVGLKKEVLKKAEEKTGGGVTGKIEVDLRASASFEVHVIITLKGSAEAGIKTGLEGNAGFYKSGENLQMDFALIFPGVMFYCNIKFSGGPQKKKKTEPGGEGKGGREITVGKDEWHHSWVLNKAEGS